MSLAIAFAVASLLGAGQCGWMCFQGTEMPMECWFSRHTGLPCDMATFLVLITLAVAGAGAALFVRVRSL